jgi:N-dimethylarginine dimethylaminohydrolase
MLRQIGVRDVIRVGLPYGAMHLDGCLSILDRDLAVVWPQRTPLAVVRTLRERGFRLIDVVDTEEAFTELSLNGVALAPGKLLMPAGGARHRTLFEEAGVECVTVEIDELIKAGGGIHCMTAFLKRDPL